MAQKILFICALVFLSCKSKQETIKPSISSISESIYASGLVKTNDQYQVFATVNGIIDQVYVQEGSVVKKGDPLFAISNETQQLNKENAQLAANFADLNANQLVQLQNYSKALGLAFQIVDDVLDATADSQTLGKTAGKDAANDKPTYVTLMGLDYAQKQAKELQETAISSLDGFGDQAQALKDLALLVVNRGK